MAGQYVIIVCYKRIKKCVKNNGVQGKKNSTVCEKSEIE